MNKVYQYVVRGAAAIAALVLSMFATSCSNDEPAFPTEPGNISFTAPTEIEGASSRVSYTQIEGKLKVKWEKGDKVYLVDGSGNKLIEFTISSKPTEHVTFTCSDILTQEDISNASGTLQYFPDDAASVKEQKQSGNGNTKHLKYANIIQSDQTISVASLLKEKQTVTFKNNTAIFRVIVKPKYTAKSGSTLKIFGSSAWDGGKGVKLTIGFDANIADAADTLYVAVPAGKVNLVLGFGILNENGYPVYEYSRLLNREYEPGAEYTADLTKITSNVTYINSKDDILRGYVNLGDAGNWATMNIGATDFVGEGSYGYYFQWGTTSKRTQPSSMNVSLDDLTRNNIKNLSEDEDAARDAWGTEWCMPTEAQCGELGGTDYQWKWCSDLNCYVVYKNVSGPLLLIPAAGYKDKDGNLLGVGSIADYWTLTGYTGLDAYCMTISNVNTDETATNKVNESLTSFARDNYLPIRPVYIGTTPSNN